MSVGNKYTLRLHYNNFDQKNSGANTNPHNSNNGSLYYHVAGGISQPYSLIALYDESFAGRYVPNSGTNTNVSLYGSLTSNGSYSFIKQGGGGSTFKFFSIHPEKYIHNGNGMEDVKFLCNEVNSASEDELFFAGSSNGLALMKKSGQPDDTVDFVINRKLVYNYDTGSLSGSILMQDQRESVIIPTSDIDPELGKEIKVGHVYKIKAATANDPVRIYDASSNSNLVGTLKSGTILVTKDHLTNGPALVFAHGAGEINHHDLIGALQLDTITLYRDENSGEFRYYFSDRKGKETSNIDLVDYCADTKNCKMKDLNLFPNVRAYIKSTLTSADIADFSSQGNVNAASVALILKQTVINDVAQELVTNKADYLGTALFHTSSGALGGTITDYINQKMPGEIAKDVGIQQAVITALKSDPGMKGPAGQQGIQGDRGPDGRPGNNGQDADPAQVAEELVKQSDTLVNAIFQTSTNALSGKTLTLVNAIFQTSTNALSGKTLEDYVEQVMPKQIAQEPVIQRAVAIELRNNPGRARGPDGPTGPRGPEGPQGIQGDRGPDGRPGNNGQDADPAQVAEELVTNKADDLGTALLHTTSAALKGKTITQYVEQDMSKEVATILKKDPGMKGPAGPAGQNGQDGRDADPAEVTHRLAHNSRFKRSLKGDDGADGERGEAGTPGLPGPEGKRGTIGQRGPVGPEGKQGQIGQQGPQGEPGQGGTSLDIAHRLAHNSRFKRSLRGDDGTDGERGEAGTPGLPGPTGQPGPEGKQGPIGPAGQNGQDGRDADPVEVTHRLAHNARFKRSLKGDDGEKGDQGLKGDTGSEGPRGDRGERGEVGPTGPQGRDGKQGEKGDQGEPGKDSVDSFPLGSGLKSSIKELQKKPQLKIVSGEPYNENIQKANIELEGVGVIATFLEIGYFFKNDNLYIRDHITGNNILIPKNFHFLTVVAEDGFENYKLAFCNNLGNLFFDYQKYGSEYAGVLEEYKTVDLRYIKNAANIDLSKYYYHHIHTPLFAVRKGELEGQSLENYRVDVYEMAKNKKIGTLVDEFGFFERDQFHYVNHHQGYEPHFQELNVGIENHEGNFQIDDHIIHPITLRDGHLNLLDYLGYS